jgi:pantoate--beta-alanine ligase
MQMKVITTKESIRRQVQDWRLSGLGIGLVPTMGYFHQGHLSLMEECRRHADRTVVSLFVNPTQFGPNEDLDTYPRDLQRDMELAERIGVDVIFMPETSEMYSAGFQTWVNVERLTTGLCGRSRPNHFRGVTTVVSKLFNIIQPDIAVFGQKDFQQLQVIRQMVKDLDFPVKIVAHPIVREPDGLAMSSRNSYLSEEERRSACSLFKALKLAERLVLQQGVYKTSEIAEAVRGVIESFPFTRIDYIFIGKPDSLTPIKEVKRPLLIALAVYVGATRLIDNILIEDTLRDVPC